MISKEKTIGDYQAFADELKVLCDKHEIDIIGTCSNEGVYGEITFFDRNHKDDTKVHWIQLPQAITYTVTFDEYSNIYCLDNENSRWKARVGRSIT